MTNSAEFVCLFVCLFVLFFDGCRQYTPDLPSGAF